MKLHNNPGFRVLKVPRRKVFEASWARVFFIFWQSFGIFDDLSLPKPENPILDHTRPITNNDKTCKMSPLEKSRLTHHEMLEIQVFIRKKKYYSLSTHDVQKKLMFNLLTFLKFVCKKNYVLNLIFPIKISVKK